ncbi:hypothetical protein [Brevibacillus reuszeri]|uniref:hypothetical protein n=1 Tax=Brevibacillus reuszeri TaxID=54915 RepID=UPI00289E3E7F|nr:hypothetical protein [Brevibacillus reuszeri]
MKTRAKWIAGAAIGAMLLTGSVFAESKWNLFINDQEFASDYLGIKQENGSVLVPVDKLAEAFHGKASIDLTKHEVRVTLPEATMQSHQVTRLEDALLATTPKEALDTWVKGIQTRNGALQYAVFSPELRTKTQKEFSENYWVTGGSSPHMAEIEKLETKQINETTTQYTFDYNLVASNWHGMGKAVVTVQKMKTDRAEGWFVTRVQLKDPGDTGLTIGVEQL